MNSQKSGELTLNELLSNFEYRYLNRNDLAHAQSIEYLEEYGQILEYLSTTGSSRKNYRHYSTRSRIERIIDKSAFYLTDGSTWNDSYDKSHFNPAFSANKQFGMCLSATTSESIAMWMLYGGIDGNGAMINFDKKTLDEAMSKGEYECGYFENGEFKIMTTLQQADIKLKLTDVLYFSTNEGSDQVTIDPVGKGRQSRISYEVFDKIAQIAKHRAWSYEKEVRLVASVSKLALGGMASKATAIKIPCTWRESFIKERVFDSPVSDGGGRYRDSELLGTVDWDLCSQCGYKISR